MLSSFDITRLDALYRKLERATNDFLGYPVSKDFDLGDLKRFLRFPINNLGDPFADSTYEVGTQVFEREVINFMGDHLRAVPNETWGYVTNGGTEGNLYGLYLARELFPRGIVYLSEAAHYSVAKNIHFLGLRSITLRCQPNGEVDYDDLCETLRINRHKPAIIFANIGTTMTEARDDVRKIKDILQDFSITDFYIHSDAALCGAFAPFLNPRPAFDFADGADSISISGHKFFGSPIPCGIVLAKRRHVERVSRSIGYIGSLDTTVTGSRNGFTPLVLWYRIKELGIDGLRDRAVQALKLAGYAETQLRDAGIPAWRNSQALTVVFPKVDDAIKSRWQLATQDDISHIIVMPNVTKAQIDGLVSDIVRDRKSDKYQIDAL